jgi:hypothetical protein
MVQGEVHHGWFVPIIKRAKICQIRIAFLLQLRGARARQRRGIMIIPQCLTVDAVGFIHITGLTLIARLISFNALVGEICATIAQCYLLLEVPSTKFRFVKAATTINVTIIRASNIQTYPTLVVNSETLMSVRSALLCDFGIATNFVQPIVAIPKLITMSVGIVTRPAVTVGFICVIAPVDFHWKSIFNSIAESLKVDGC